MGWFWLVPTFHMTSGEDRPVHLKLSRKDLDFPLGAGSWITEVDVEMEWVREQPRDNVPNVEGATVGTETVTPLPSTSMEPPSQPETGAGVGEEKVLETAEAFDN